MDAEKQKILEKNIIKNVWYVNFIDVNNVNKMW